MNVARRFIAELAGTLVLVFVGAGSAVADSAWNLGLGNTGVAVVFGVVVFAMIKLIGPISGAHINPIVSLAFYIERKMSGRLLLSYVAAQFLGALLGGALWLIMFSRETTVAGCTLAKDEIWIVAGAEILFSFILVLTILLSVATQQKPLAKLALFVGGAVFLGALLSGPISGGSMNPARTIGPAIAAGEYSHIWIYFTAPLLGALAASGINQLALPYIRTRHNHQA